MCFYRLGKVATFLQELQWTQRSLTHQSLTSTFAVMLAFRLELNCDHGGSTAKIKASPVPPFLKCIYLFIHHVCKNVAFT